MDRPAGPPGRSCLRSSKILAHTSRSKSVVIRNGSKLSQMDACCPSDGCSPKQTFASRIVLNSRPFGQTPCKTSENAPKKSHKSLSYYLFSPKDKQHHIMAEHILLAQSISSPADLNIVEAVIRILLKDQGALEFMASGDYNSLRQNALALHPQHHTIMHNNIRLSIRPLSSIRDSVGCTLSISRIYPHLKPAGVESRTYIAKATVPGVAALVTAL